MFAFSLLAVAASSASAPHQKIPEPVGSIQGLFSANDYPVEALDRNEQGHVGTVIRVDATGAISDCLIEKSSGSAALDRRTCELIRLRAKYKPAHDRRGRAVASEAHETVTWRIEEDLPEASDPWAVNVVMSYGTDGQPLSCRVEAEGAKTGSGPSTCSASPIPAELKQLGAISQLVVQQRLAFGANPPPTLGADDLIIGRMVLDLRVDAEGRITSCEVTEQSAELRGADGCRLFAPKRFVPHKGPDGGPAPFAATFGYTNYIHVRRNLGPTT